MRYQIYLRKEASENLELMAKAYGVTPSQLLKMWLEPNLTFDNLKENILRIMKEEKEAKRDGKHL